jgi:hypothetical protein
MQAHSITVLDSRGYHLGVHVSPPSRQPKPRPAGRFDKAAIMRRAWVGYRTYLTRTPAFLCSKSEDRRFWAYHLRMAWLIAKAEVEKAERLAAMRTEPVTFTTPKPLTGRAAEIAAELLAIEYSDAWAIPTGNRVRSLRAELAELSA